MFSVEFEHAASVLVAWSLVESLVSILGSAELAVVLLLPRAVVMWILVV